MATLPAPPSSNFTFVNVETGKRLRLESRELHTFLLLLWKMATGGGTGSLGIVDANEETLALSEASIKVAVAAIDEKVADSEGQADTLQAQIISLQQRMNEFELSLTMHDPFLLARIEEVEDLALL